VSLISAARVPAATEQAVSSERFYAKYQDDEAKEKNVDSPKTYLLVSSSIRCVLTSSRGSEGPGVHSARGARTPERASTRAQHEVGNVQRDERSR